MLEHLFTNTCAITQIWTNTSIYCDLNINHTYIYATLTF